MGRFRFRFRFRFGHFRLINLLSGSGSGAPTKYAVYVPPPPGILGLPTVLEVNPTLVYRGQGVQKIG